MGRRFKIILFVFFLSILPLLWLGYRQLPLILEQSVIKALKIKGFSRAELELESLGLFSAHFGPVKLEQQQFSLESQGFDLHYEPLALLRHRTLQGISILETRVRLPEAESSKDSDSLDLHSSALSLLNLPFHTLDIENLILQSSANQYQLSGRLEKGSTGVQATGRLIRNAQSHGFDCSLWSSQPDSPETLQIACRLAGNLPLYSESGFLILNYQLHPVALIRKQELELKFALADLISLQKLSFPYIASEKLDITLTENAMFKFSQQDMQNFNMHLALLLESPAISFPGCSLQNSTHLLELDVQGEFIGYRTIQNLQASGKLRTQKSALQTSAGVVPESELEADFSLAENSVQLNGSVFLNQRAAEIKILLEHNLESAAGRLEQNLRAVHFTKTKPLSSFLTPWPFDFDLKSGTLSAQSSLHWPVSESSQLWNFDLQNVGGSYREIPISDINSSPAFTSLWPLVSSAPVQMKIAGINPGLPVTQLEGAIKFEKSKKSELPTIKISDFKAELLGGQARAQRLSYSPDRKLNRFAINLKGIDLAALVALEGQERIDASGTLDGTLPVLLDEQGLHIEKGRIEARGTGGYIRLKDQSARESLASAGASVDFVMDALENYNYNFLVSSVSYSPNGDLLLGLELKGRNPDLNKTRPLHFNINVEENIPALLKTLRISQDLEDQLVRAVSAKQDRK